MRLQTTFGCVFLLTTAFASGAPIIRSGTTGGSLDAALAQFRIDIGGGSNNANTPGTQLTGHREINWDAAIVPVLPSLLPGSFFNSPPTTRGLLMATPGTGLMVSDVDFINIDATYGTQFNAFSGAKTIAAQGSNIMDVTFAVPGASTPATVRGFGVVFSDVDNASATSLQFFAGATSLGTFFAPVSNEGFSFLGVTFDTSQVTRVRITVGTAALGAGVMDISQDGVNDLVIMDDFLYSEPQAAAAAIPEPMTTSLVGGGLLALVVARRRRQPPRL